MKENLRKKLPIILIILLPFFYLAYTWDDLPNQVPLHWNSQGEIDRWGDKSQLILICVLLPLLTYLIFFLVPIIDPKKKISKMGNKLHSLKFVLTLFMTVLAMLIVFAVKNHSFSNPNLMYISMGVLFTILGNFFKTIKSNYFIGIRTPWTLENEIVWKETHILGGKLWFVGGLVIVISSLFINTDISRVIFLTVTGIITIIPIVFSYIRFKNINK